MPPPAIDAATVIAAGGRGAFSCPSTPPQPAAADGGGRGRGSAPDARDPHRAGESTRRRLQARLRAVRSGAYHQPSVPLAAAPDLLAHPLATAEFLAVDTETNGLARRRAS